MRKLAIPLPKLINKEQQWKLTLLENWNTLTQDLAAKVVLLSISPNAITLGVTHSIFAQEVSYSSIELRNSINALLPNKPIKNIYIKIIIPPKGKTSERKALKGNVSLQNKPQKQYALTIQEQHKLNNVEDTALKQIMKQFLIRCKKFS